MFGRLPRSRRRFLRRMMHRRASNFHFFFPSFIPASRRTRLEGDVDDRHENRKRRSDLMSTSSPVLKPAFGFLSWDPFTRQRRRRRRRPSHGIRLFLVVPVGFPNRDDR